MIVRSETLLVLCHRSIPSPEPTPSPTDSPRQLDVFLHNRHSLGVNGAQVGILEQMDHECFCRLLQCLNSRGLPAQVITADEDKREGNFSDKAGKG